MSCAQSPTPQRVNKIKKKLKRDYRELFELTFVKNDFGITECTLDNKEVGKHIVISLTDNLNYNNIRLYIEKCCEGSNILNPTPTTPKPTSTATRFAPEVICQICLTVNRICNCRCIKCGEAYCPACYVELYRAGLGLIKCPFCRDTIGVEEDESDIEDIVIFMKFQNGWVF